MFMRKMALLAKIEAAYGVDSTPTGAANSILARNVNISPLEVEEEERNIQQPYLGNSGKIVTSFYGKIDFEVELAGSGAAGTPPKCGPLLRSCSLAEAITVAMKVLYTPVSAGFESVVLYFHLDGVLHVFTGSRGTVQKMLNAKAIPVFKFSYTGLFNAVTDVALPTAVYTGFVTPLAVNKANTPTFTLHGYAAVLKSLTLDMANEIQYRNLVNYEGVDNVDRQPGGSVEFESTLMATKNWFAIAKDKTAGALNIIHGVTAGNIVQIQAPNVLLSQPKYSEDAGVVMISAGLELQPSTAGNDEISIEFR